ncbi:MAG: hypothetical protein ACI89L_001910 [Phycisphaerales bacterium]|jgi:hypothetical protein
MPDRPSGNSSAGLNEAMVKLLIEEHEGGVKPRLEKLWAYFRNPLEPVGVAGGTGGASGDRRWYRQAQEAGLPTRIVGGARSVLLDDRGSGRREVVIENDIGWRVQAMVDFLFGRPLQLVSGASDESVRPEIERVLEAVWEASGGVGMLQDAALLGHVFGHVDFVVRIDEDALRDSAGLDPATVAAESIRIEPVDPRRGVPMVSASDYRELDGYVIHFERELNEVEATGEAGDNNGAANGMRRRLFGRDRARAASQNGFAASGELRRKTGTVTEVFTPGEWARYEDGERVAHETTELLGGAMPVVHVQNLSQPFVYTGFGEVEGLVPLQDELNTRLSDRANRVTMQSFKMYLAKRMGEGVRSVGPGEIWETDDPDATVEAFGGDGHSPSEDSHIEQIREALDKVSGVPPLAGGVVRGRIGNLSSATALRITLLSVLSKTARKRVTYGRGMSRVCGLILRAMDEAGVFETSERDRVVRVGWPEAVPVDGGEEARAASAKVALGADRDRVLSELGFAAGDPGIA